MKIQQHDDVVVEVAGSRQGFAKHHGRGGVGREVGLCQNFVYSSHAPPHYI